MQTAKEILSINEVRDQYWLDHETNRVILLPQGWATELNDPDPDPSDPQVYCWYGNEHTLAAFERDSKEWLTTDSQGWFSLDRLGNMRDIGEPLARQLDPNLFKLLDAINSGADELTECECDNTHKQNDTVCRFCWSQGKRHWED